MDFLLQKSSNNRSVSASTCCYLYNSLCKFIVEYSENVDTNLIELGKETGCKIPDIIARHKVYPSLEETERYLLFVLNEYWKIVGHKAVQVIERSDVCVNECKP